MPSGQSCLVGWRAGARGPRRPQEAAGGHHASAWALQLLPLQQRKARHGPGVGDGGPQAGPCSSEQLQGERGCREGPLMWELVSLLLLVILEIHAVSVLSARDCPNLTQVILHGKIAEFS